MSDINFEIAFNDGGFLKTGGQMLDLADQLIEKQNRTGQAFTNMFKAASDGANKQNRAFDELNQKSRSILQAQLQQEQITKNLAKEKGILSKAIDSVKKGYDNLVRAKDLHNLKTKEERAERIALLREYAKSRDALKEGIQNYSVFGVSINGVKSAFSQVNNVSKLWIKTLGATRVALLATGIGALLVALGSLVSFLTKTREGTDFLNKAMTVFGAITEGLVDVVNSLGKIIFDAFTNPKQAVIDLSNTIKDILIEQTLGRIQSLGKAVELVFKGQFREAAKESVDIFTGVNNTVEKVTGSVKVLGEEMANVISTAIRIADAETALFNLNQQLLRDTARSRAEIKELNKIGEDTTRTYEERSQAIQKAISIEQDLLNRRIEAAEKNLQLVRDTNANQSDVDQREAIEAETQAIELLEGLRAESLELQTTLTNKLNTINAERNRQIQAEAKAVQDLQRQYQDLENQLNDQIQAVQFSELTPIEQVQKRGEIALKSLENQKSIMIALANELGKPTEDIENNFNNLIDAINNEVEQGIRRIETQDLAKLKFRPNFDLDLGILSDETELKSKEFFDPETGEIKTIFETVEKPIPLTVEVDPDFTPSNDTNKSIGEFVNDLSDSIRDIFDSDIFRDAFDVGDALINSISGFYDAELQALDRLNEQRQDRIDQLRDDLELENDLLEEGSAANVETKKEELNQLLLEQEAANEKQLELQKKQAKLQAAANIAQQVSSTGLAIANIFKAHSGIPFVGVALAAGYVAAMIATIASAKKQLSSLHTGANRIGDYTGYVSKGGPTDKPNSGSQGFAVVDAKTGKDTYVRLGGNEMLMSERTTHAIGDIVQDIEKNPSKAKALREFYEGIDSTPLIAEQSRNVDYLFINQNKGITKEEMLSIMDKAFENNRTKSSKEVESETWVPNDQSGQLITRFKDGSISKKRIKKRRRG